MACFLVSAAEAAVTTIAAKEAEKKEVENQEVQSTQIPFSRKLSWLRNMLLGGSVLLMFEHIWHGEITAWFPFLTAAESAS